MAEENQVNPKNEINEAFAKAQKTFKQPTLNRMAEVKKDGKLLYTTHYADLNECIECVRAPLTEQGLSFTQGTEFRNGWILALVVRHASGETLESIMPIKLEGLTFQQIGSQLTYLKRYQFAAFFGLAADFDDDGNGAEGNNATFGSTKGSQPQNKNQGQRPQNQNKQQQKPANQPPNNPKHTTGATAPTPPTTPDTKPVEKPPALNTAPKSISTAQRSKIEELAMKKSVDLVLYLDPKTIEMLSQQEAYDVLKSLNEMK